MALFEHKIWQVIMSNFNELSSYGYRDCRLVKHHKLCIYIITFMFILTFKYTDICDIYNNMNTTDITNQNIVPMKVHDTSELYKLSKNY